MKLQQDRREKGLRWLMGLGAAVLTTVVVAATIVLGLPLTGLLPLLSGMLCGLALPIALLFVAWLIQFPWGKKVIMVVFVGVMFIMSSEMVISIRNHQRQRGLETQPGVEAALTPEHHHSDMSGTSKSH